MMLVSENISLRFWYIFSPVVHSTALSCSYSAYFTSTASRLPFFSAE